MQILISAGEASGEMYGAQLIEALRHRDPSLQFFGAGGERMRAAGCEIVVDAKDLAVVGITEVVSRLPKIYGLFRRLIAEADRRKPDLAVVIDSPAFNWRVARQMHKRGIPVVYYVCPQFWAWRQGRVKLLRKYVNKALVIFPFEEKFYRDRGVDATFVGHPLADLPAPAITRESYAAEHVWGGHWCPQHARLSRDGVAHSCPPLDPAKPWITLMPGSRRKEVRMNLPTILEAAARLEKNRLEKDRPGNGYEFLLPVAPMLEPRFLKDLMETQQAASLHEGHRIHLVPEALPALFHSRAGIVASGTATVEAALMGTPFVMVYRVSPLTYAVGRPQVKVPHYAMVNLIAGEEIVPELVQHHFTAGNIVTELSKIIPDGEPRTRMIQSLAAVKTKLRRSTDNTHAPERAANVIVGMLSIQ